MATKLEPEYPSSPNDDSDGEGQDSLDSSNENVKKPENNNVADILKRLQSSGALIKKPKQEYRCVTCDEDFSNWEDLENHLIKHVSLPSVVIDKLPSDDEDTVPSGDENWSDEEEDPPTTQPPAQKTPQKIDISQILKKTGLSIKKPAGSEQNDSALNKLTGLGFTIKKSTTPIKEEKEPKLESKSTNDVMQKLGQLGGIKLKLKSDGNNANTFKVVNGLKDFKTSDDEDEGDDENEERDDQEFEEPASGGEQESGDEQSELNNSKTSESDESEPLINKKIANSAKNLQASLSGQKIVSAARPVPSAIPIKSPAKEPTKLQSRPAVKQTPKRGANLPVPVKEITNNSEPLRRQSEDTTSMDKVVVKQEDTSLESNSSNVPLFSGQIKTERTSPPPSESQNISTPIISAVKTEPGAPPVSSQPLYSNQNIPSIQSSGTTPLLPVTKTEDPGVTIIEINGDSNDEDDDDCCVVSATPAPDVKPIIPKIENPPSSYPPPVSYPSSQPNFNSSSSVLSSRLSSTPSTAKQHNFNWNAPDTKPPIDILEKSADDIFESLLSTSTKKELSLSDASEYISLDTLGPQHSCEVCNTRFTDLSLLDDHRRMTGHSMSLVAAPSSSTLLPYNPSSNILSSLLPVKQLAEQVGKLVPSGMGGTSSGFTHQQNVMINIQAYPGAGGVMPQTYNSYPSGQNMHSGYPQAPNNMFGAAGQTMPGQYPGQSYMGQPQGYGQFQSPMSKPSYPGTMPQNSYSTASSPYSSASPLQSMQQSVYGQPSGSLINQQVGQMGSAPPYPPTSSPGGAMKPPTGSSIRIQNVQTFPPGQFPGQTVTSGQDMPQGQGITPGQTIGQMHPPSQIRMAANANISGARPRMPTIRGPRPTIRPGIQVHGQVRGAKPGMRMPMKRPGGMVGGPGQKRRSDMLLPGKHDNEDCQVMAMQKQREGLPLIQSVQGAKDKPNLGSQISITKKTVNKEASAMANVLASRGISVKQKQKSRSPTPERPVPHIPNLGAGVSIKHTSKSSNFTIPEAKVGGGMLACKICKKMFMNNNSLSVHMMNAHPQSKIPVFKCDECPASYPKSLQLQHHKRVFHNVSGPNRELGLPVVDLSQEDNLKRLSNLGIYSFIPLANREQASGCFGIPVISVHNMQNGMTTSLQALGADGLLSLGPLKTLPNS